MRQGGSYITKPDGSVVREEFTEQHPEGGARQADGAALDQAQPPPEAPADAPAPAPPAQPQHED